MKLAALGLVTVGTGVVLDVPGLIGIGLFWIALGIPVRIYGRRLKAAFRTPDWKTFALGTLLWVVLGAPSLVVGLMKIGIGAEHEEWRWLPLVVGALALGIGVIGAVLFLTGSAITATTGNPEHEAVIWIQAMRETGTFINERPRIEFDLRVEPEPTTGLASYEVTKKATVPFTALGALQVGHGFRALVTGPESPTEMEIRWEQPVTGAGPATP